MVAVDPLVLAAYPGISRERCIWSFTQRLIIWWRKRYQLSLIPRARLSTDRERICCSDFVMMKQAFGSGRCTRDVTRFSLSLSQDGIQDGDMRKVDINILLGLSLPTDSLDYSLDLRQFIDKQYQSSSNIQRADQNASRD